MHSSHHKAPSNKLPWIWGSKRMVMSNKYTRWQIDHWYIFCHLYCTIHTKMLISDKNTRWRRNLLADIGRPLVSRARYNIHEKMVMSNKYTRWQIDHWYIFCHLYCTIHTKMLISDKNTRWRRNLLADIGRPLVSCARTYNIHEKMVMSNKYTRWQIDHWYIFCHLYCTIHTKMLISWQKHKVAKESAGWYWETSCVMCQL